MSSKRTLSGALGLVFLAAALWSGSAMAAGPTPAAIRADGLRWQAMADFYKDLQSPTPAGIKADGLRWQAIARFYEQQQRPTPAGIKADGLRWQGIAKVYRDRETAGSGPTALGLKADGLRWQGIAKVYQEQQSTAGGAAFDWGDWAIGLGSGIVLILALVGLLAFALQRRHRLQAA